MQQIVPFLMANKKKIVPFLMSNKKKRAKKIERSPYYPPKLVSQFILQPLTLLWFKLQPQTIKTVQNASLAQVDLI